MGERNRQASAINFFFSFGEKEEFGKDEGEEWLGPISVSKWLLKEQVDIFLSLQSHHSQIVLSLNGKQGRGTQ